VTREAFVAALDQAAAGWRAGDAAAEAEAIAEDVDYLDPYG